LGLSGKYDFKGIKRLGAAVLRGALSSSPYTAWLVRFPALTNFILEFLTNWLANKGLLVLNVIAIEVEGAIDQKGLDEAIDKAINEIKVKGGKDKLTPEEKKAIDDEVIKSARKFLVIAKSKPK
jgi:ABC-type branched-subunit amino acid transport system substrate-binding protein